MKKLKKSFLKTILAAVFLTLIIPASAHANHQGSQPLYGHFGQPHNYVVSGEFTFSVQVHGKIDRVNYRIVKANDINKVLGTYGATSTSKGYDGDTLYNLVWNSAGFEDGDYRLYAEIESDTATPNGWRDTVVHYNGVNYLEFIVKNPVVMPIPPTQPPENNCNTKLNKANKITSKIYDKQKKNFEYIDSFMQQVTVFATNHSTTTYEAELKSINETRNESSDLLIGLDTIKTLNCDNSLDVQVSNYLKESAKTRNSLDKYKDSVINFILTVIGDMQ